MLLLIAYDVKTASPGGPKRLRRVAKACEDFGQRVQFSLFECEMNPDQWVHLRARLLDIIDPLTDSIRVYNLGANWSGKVEHHGAKPSVDFNDTLLW